MSRTTCRPRLRQGLRRGENGFIFVAAMCLGFMVTTARGGSLDDLGAPTDPSSAMYTARDIYNRLAFGTNAPKRAGAFTEPTAGPTAGTMPTTDEIMAKAPATNAAGAVEGAVLSGKMFWGLTQGAWGTRTGTIATVTLSPDNDTVSNGYYAATTLHAVDADLAATNIAINVAIFGITGTLYPAAVPKTGQTNSYATRDDGALTKGVAWPNPRFSPVATNGAETNQIRDNLTGLIWARDASNACGAASAQANWGTAVTNCNNLNYGGQTDWRLPNVRELHSLIDFQYYGPALSDGIGTNQWTEALGPFTGVQSNFYWSSSTHSADTDSAWRVSPYYGYASIGAKTTTYYVWPVRGP